MPAREYKRLERYLIILTGVIDCSSHDIVGQPEVDQHIIANCFIIHMLFPNTGMRRPYGLFELREIARVLESIYEESIIYVGIELCDAVALQILLNIREGRFRNIII